MKTLREIFFILMSICLCLQATANNCDSTFQLFKTIKTIGIDRSAKYPEELQKLKKECILEMLDSINDNNYYRIIHIITMYYVFIEPDVCKNVYVGGIDSTIFAKISYGLSNKNLEIAEMYRSHLETTGQLLWILQRNSLTIESLREYVINHKGNVNRQIVLYISSIKDTSSFWLIYKNIKEERKNDSEALIFLIHCGIEYFGYYSLFIENAADLIRRGNSTMVIRSIIKILPQKYSYDEAKKIFSKLVLDKQLMCKLSSCHGQNMKLSVFNYDFYRGIPIFYPNVAKSNEYVDICFKGYLHSSDMNVENNCEFDKRLYDLLVKTIKAEYKDLK
jgi:hypothetical protein